MSWSISFIGTPEKIAKALQDHSEKLEGQSKIEYDDVLPSLVGVVKQNFGNENQMLKVDASGHGTFMNAQQPKRQCSVSVQSFYSELL